MAQKVAVAYCVHDDHWFLADSIRSFAPLGDVFVFVSEVPWNGEAGDWQVAAAAARAAGAEVIEGEWPAEILHRTGCLAWLRERGYAYAVIPDSDEIAEPLLTDSLRRLADAGLVQRVQVHMDTYWKSPSVVIRPRERLWPTIMVELEAVWPDDVNAFNGRLFVGGRSMVLTPDYGVLHHLSYVGPDERIKRKTQTWSHAREVLAEWYRQIWLGWDRDPFIRNLHPTHPECYGWTERICRPECLENVAEYRTLTEDPPVPEKWPKVSVVIPLYGGEEDIRLCLASLEKVSDLVHETIVVDDVSPDRAAQVAAKFETATVLRNEKNLGFAGACNRGFEASSGDVVLFLNSDTVVPRAGLIRLIETLMNSGSVGAAGPYTNNAGYQQQAVATYTDIKNLDLFARDFSHRQVDDQDVSMLVGFCLAVRRSVLLEVGAFDECFGRGLFEDNDLSYRIQRAGYRCRISGRAFIHHTGSQSLPRMDVHPNTLLAKNMKAFNAKWREEVESGFASHLPGQRAEPITFRQERHPERIKRELAKLRERANVSLIMIVRDEERVLGDCLKSVDGVFSQVVIVDTGSNDRTREIAKASGAELHEFPWTDSFSDARNESLKYARGDWVFWMDADDTLPRSSAEALLQAVVSAPGDLMGFVVPVQFLDDGTSAGTRVDHVKLFRNLPGISFEGRIHEQILGSLRKFGGRIDRLDKALVLHSGYDTSAEGQAKKRDRDEKLLRLDLNERPRHPFVLFNLGMTAHYTGAHKEAVSWLNQSLEVADCRESHVRKAYALLGVSMRELGQSEAALQIFNDGLAAVGNDPELRFQAGLVLTSLGRFAEAYEQYMQMPADISGQFNSIDIAILGSKRLHNLGFVCLHLDRFKEAQVFLNSAINQGSIISAQLLFDELMKRHDIREAKEVMQQVLDQEGQSETWAGMLVQVVEFLGGNPDAALSAAISVHPTSMGPRLLLARRLVRANLFHEAMPHLAYLSGCGLAEAAFYEGLIAYQTADRQKALDSFTKAKHLNPDHAPTRQWLAKVTSEVPA